MNEPNTDHLDTSRIDAKIIEAMRGTGNRGPLVMVAEISDEINEPKRIVQMRLHSMSLKNRVFRHELAGDTTYHLEPKEPHVEKPVPDRHYDRNKVDHDDGEVSATFDDATYAEMETLILLGIDAKKRTLPQIKEHAAFSRNLDISDVISGMCIEKKIRREDNGNITAFFRYKDKPKRFWLGNRTVEAEFDPDYQVRPADLEAKKAAELLGHGVDDDAAVKLLGDTQSKATTKPVINAEQLELLAESIQSADSIAKAFGLVNAAALHKVLRSNDELRDAMDRGRRKYAQRNNPTHDFSGTAEPIGVREEEKPLETAPKPPVLDQKPQEITQNPTPAATIPAAREEKSMSTGTATARSSHHGAKGIPWSVELFKAAHDAGKSKNDIAEDHNCSPQAVSQQLAKRPDFLAAFEGKSDEEIAAAAKLGPVKTEKPVRGDGLSGKRTRDAITLDPIAVENAAAETSTRVEMCEILGIGLSTWDRKKDIPEVKAAYERGLARRPGEPTTQNEVSAIDEMPEPPTNEMVASAEELAEAVHPEPPAKAVEISDAWKKRDAAVTQTEPQRTSIIMEIDEPETALDIPAATEAIEIDTRKPNEDQAAAHANGKDDPLRAELEARVVNRLLGSIFSPKPVSTSGVMFEDGGKLTVTFDGNYFALKQNEREFLDEMVERLANANKRQQTKTA